MLTVSLLLNVCDTKNKDFNNFLKEKLNFLNQAKNMTSIWMKLLHHIPESRIIDPDRL